MASQARKTIVVIGAGVLGLSTALTLLETIPSSEYRILLLASHFPADGRHPSYPSSVAGAHYRPVPATTPQLKHEASLAEKTYLRMKTLALEHPEYGIKFLEGIDYVSGEAASPYKALVPEYTQLEGFRVLNADELPAGVDFGARYETYTLDPEVYLFHLLRRYQLRGGAVNRVELKSLPEAFEAPGENVSLVVNCTGMGFGDPHSFIIRGQTCLVRNACDKTITKQADDGWSLFIPRPLEGGTIIGGTRQPYDWRPMPEESVRKELLENAAKLYPAALNENGEFDVICDIVGRRPAREGGMRLEVETLPGTSPGSRTVVHAYGAGARGYELSWGVAEEVLGMVQNSLLKRPHSRL